VPRRRLTRRVLADGTPRRALMTTLLLLVIVFVSCLVAASPFALRMLDLQSRDWERLSWVGQTYGAASALLSVLALIGIAVSLTLQARESNASREQSRTAGAECRSGRSSSVGPGSVGPGSERKPAVRRQLLRLSHPGAPKAPWPADPASAARASREQRGGSP
jgi:hypothetical protein